MEVERKLNQKERILRDTQDEKRGFESFIWLN